MKIVIWGFTGTQRSLVKSWGVFMKWVEAEEAWGRRGGRKWWWWWGSESEEDEEKKWSSLERSRRSSMPKQSCWADIDPYT